MVLASPRLAALALFVCALPACRRTEEPAPAPAASATATTPASPPPVAAAPGAASAGGGVGTTGAAAGELQWTAPERFQPAPNPSPMRKATYRVPGASTAEDAELSVSQAGGSVDANITRWVGQFEGGDKTLVRKERTVGDLKVTIVDVKGTFESGMPGMGGGEPKKGWALRGAIVETDPPHFFKLTGPAKTVAAATADFDKLIDSLRKP